MMNHNDKVRHALQWMDDEGWSKLIDPRWTLEVYHELQTSKLNLSDADIREALDIVVYGKSDYNISMHKLLQHSHGILHRIGNKLHPLP